MLRTEKLSGLRRKVALTLVRGLGFGFLRHFAFIEKVFDFLSRNLSVRE